MKNQSMKVYKLLIDLHETKHFNAKEMQSKHQIGTRIFTLLRERDMIRKDSNGMHKYIAEMPTQIVANALTKEVKKQARIYNVDYKKHRNQITIQPLKRVERIAPVKQPVQVEEQHTPYPIMDIVIAFLAGMIAAGFISIIWK
jgi:hypothetical protein